MKCGGEPDSRSGDVVPGGHLEVHGVRFLPSEVKSLVIERGGKKITIVDKDDEKPDRIGF